MTDWGRVAEDGTVFVATADGEREVGSWQAGSPAEGLAHFARRFEQLATEVALLEQRLGSGVGDPGQVTQSAQRLKDAVPTAAAVGDLAGLERRIDGLLEQTASVAEAAQARKAEQREQAVLAKTALAEEAERLGGSSEWRSAGDRLRNLGQDWKKVLGVDKKTDRELWERVAAARKRFSERRRTHFAALAEQREVSKARKERLIRSAEELSSSTDWKGTAARYKQLMIEWKAAGRAPREVDDDLWGRFRAAQDVFFQARSAQFAEQDNQLSANQGVKEALLVEAEELDPAQGDPAKRKLRELQEKWEEAGKVPRTAARSLENRMGKVEESFRQVSDKRFSQGSESPFVVRLREKVIELEGKLLKAEAAGRPTDELQSSLETQRQWLSQAGVNPAEVSRDAGPQPENGVTKKPTTGWVRADT